MAVLTALVACDGSDPDTDTDAPTPTPEVRVSMSGNISLWPSFTPADGAEVCYRTGGEDTCATTNATGNYTIDEIPGNTTGGVRISHPDLVTTWIPIVVGTEDVEASLGVDSPAFRDAYYTDAGVTPTPGHVVVTIQGTSGPPMYQGESGAVPSLTPASGQGPFFLGTGGTIDPAAVATDGFGVSIFLDVDPDAGPFTMDFNMPNCETAQEGVGVPTLEIPDDVEAVFFQFMCE
jgi:hypothetical protein